jgi:hypothetical protein
MGDLSPSRARAAAARALGGAGANLYKTPLVAAYWLGVGYGLLTHWHCVLLAALDQRQQHARALEGHLHLAGDEVVDGRAAAAIGDMHDVDRSRQISQVDGRDGDNSHHPPR